MAGKDKEPKKGCGCGCGGSKKSEPKEAPKKSGTTPKR